MPLLAEDGVAFWGACLIASPKSLDANSLWKRPTVELERQIPREASGILARGTLAVTGRRSR